MVFRPAMFKRGGKTWYRGSDSVQSKEELAEAGEVYFTETKEDAEFYGENVMEAAPQIDNLKTIEENENKIMNIIASKYGAKIYKCVN